MRQELGRRRSLSSGGSRASGMLKQMDGLTLLLLRMRGQLVFVKPTGSDLGLLLYRRPHMKQDHRQVCGHRT
jgi:hypothetical protein